MSFLARFPGNTNISVRTRSTFNDVSGTNFNFHFHISIEDGNCNKNIQANMQDSLMTLDC